MICIDFSLLTTKDTFSNLRLKKIYNSLYFKQKLFNMKNNVKNLLHSI